MRTVGVTILIYLFLSILSSSHAEDTLIVVINDTPPWKMIENGKAKGIDINITDEIASRLHLNVEYRQFPFKRCLMYLKNGEADLMGFLSYKQERTTFLQYLQPPYQGDTKIFYVRKGEAHRLENYDDLYKLRVGLISGHKHFEPFDSDEKLRKSETINEESIYMMLLANRIDTMIENDTQGPYNVHRFGLADKLEIAPYKVPLGKNGFFAMSKKSKHLNRIAEFESVLQNMVDSGEINTIIEKSLNAYLFKKIENHQ